jgi:hypothetical protein
MFRKPYHFCPPKKPEMCGPSSDPNKKLWLNQNFVAGMVSEYSHIRSMPHDDCFFSVNGHTIHFDEWRHIESPF